MNGHLSDEGRFLRIDDVVATTGLSRRTIYRLVLEGNFPSQYRLSKRSVGWWQSTIDDWLRSRLQAPTRA